MSTAWLDSRVSRVNCPRVAAALQGVLGLVAGVALLSAAEPAVICEIDFAASRSAGPMVYPALGFLTASANSPNNIPLAERAALYTPLQVGHYRVPPETVASIRAIDDRAFILTTLSGGWGHPTGGRATLQAPWAGVARGTPNPGTYETPNWSSWLDAVESVVKQTIAANPNIALRGYDFWNEANSKGGRFWGKWNMAELADQAAPHDGLPDMPRFKECWQLTYRLLKTGLTYQGKTYPPLDPHALLTAPGTTEGITGNPADFVKAFMSYCKENDCVPDAWNWHFGDDAIARQVKEVDDHGKALGVNRDKMILEYLKQANGKKPGRSAYEIILLTQAAKHGLVRACEAKWPTTTYLGNCLADRGLQATPRFVRQGVWHVFDFYGNMLGARVDGDFAGSEPVNWLASIGADQAWLLFGSHDTDAASLGTIAVDIRNIKPVAGSQVTVTVTRIPYASESDEPGAVPDLPPPALHQAYLLKNNSLSFAFEWTNNRDAYQVHIANVARAKP